MADTSQMTKLYRVRIVTSNGAAERTIEAISTMAAYQQTMADYPYEEVLYSLSVRPLVKPVAEQLAA